MGLPTNPSSHINLWLDPDLKVRVYTLYNYTMHFNIQTSSLPALLQSLCRNYELRYHLCLVTSHLHTQPWTRIQIHIIHTWCSHVSVRIGLCFCGCDSVGGNERDLWNKMFLCSPQHLFPWWIRTDASLEFHNWIDFSWNHII